MKTRTQRLIVLLSSLSLAATAPLSAQQGAALGPAGEVFLAKTGTYSELFKGNDPTQSKNPVLALEIVKPGETTKRYLVPTTGGTEIELAPSLLFEESSDTVFLLWESRLYGIFPVLKLAGFDGKKWIDPIEIGNPTAMKSSPQFAITQDNYNVLAEEDQRVRTRMIVHLLWGQETGNGSAQILYTPIILENGAFTGAPHEQIFDLGDLDPSASAAGLLPELPGNLAAALRLRPGRDGQTVVAVFTSPKTRRVVSVEIDLLSAELSLLAGEARSHIIDIGRKASYPSNIKLVAGEARSHIIDIGRRVFHTEIARSIADQIHDDIVSNDGQDNIERLADIARSHIIDIGARLSGRGLLQATGAAVSVTVEIPGSTPTSSDEPLQHILQFRLASSRPAPEVGASDVTLFASKSGKDVLVAWAEPQRVLYYESRGDEWRELQEIKLSASVDLEKAYLILEQRMSRR